MTGRTRTALRLTGAAGVLAVAVGAGCGSGDDGRFDESVAAVREAVATQDRTYAMQALDDIALRALAARDDGAIDGEQLAELVTLIDSSRALVDRLIAAEGPPATDPPPPDPPPAPGAADAHDDREHDDRDEPEDRDDRDEPEDRDDRDDEGKGRARGKGKGHGGRDD
jgi:hypothetical protein